MHRAVRQAGVLKRQHRSRKERSVDRAGAADGECTHGNACGHLHDGEKRILPGKRLGFHRHAEYGERCHCGGHAGEVGGTARTRDDRLKPLVAGVSGEVIKTFGCAMRRDNTRLILDTELVERVCGVAHRCPVGLASHDNRHSGGPLSHQIPSQSKMRL